MCQNSKLIEVIMEKKHIFLYFCTNNGKKTVDDDPKTAADRKRRLLMVNKKNVTSKRAKPTPPLSDITSSIVNRNLNSHSKTSNHSNIQSSPSNFQESKENTKTYVPDFSLFGNLCENNQPSTNHTPIHNLPNQNNAETLQDANKVTRQKKKKKRSKPPIRRQEGGPKKGQHQQNFLLTCLRFNSILSLLLQIKPSSQIAINLSWIILTHLGETYLD